MGWQYGPFDSAPATGKKRLRAGVAAPPRPGEAGAAGSAQSLRQNSQGVRKEAILPEKRVGAEVRANSAFFSNSREW